MTEPPPPSVGTAAGESPRQDTGSFGDTSGCLRLRMDILVTKLFNASENFDTKW